MTKDEIDAQADIRQELKLGEQDADKEGHDELEEDERPPRRKKRAWTSWESTDLEDY